MPHGFTVLKIKFTITNPELSAEDIQDVIEDLEDLVNTTYLDMDY